MQTIIVTGGSGFIGSHFIRQWLHEEGTHVVNIDKLTYASNPMSVATVANSPKYTFYAEDIGNRLAIRRILANRKPFAVVHFAAESHVDRSIDTPNDFVQTNVVGTCNLLEECRDYWHDMPVSLRSSFRFLNVSTDEVFGTLGPQGAFSEQSPYAPNSPYSASKAAGDFFTRAFHRTYGLPTLTTNCSNNYGPFQHPEKLIPLVTTRCLKGEPLPVYGNGQQVRDWLHVSDHCRAIRLVLHHGRPGDTYNIGGDAEFTNLEVVHAIARAVDSIVPNHPFSPCSKLIKHVSDRLGHDTRYAINFTKIHRELDWSPTVPFEEGLRETVLWYAQHFATPRSIASS